ncbi:MAG: flagellar motor stator protein MotA [Deltaproteobacteria bacterium]|jgi:chemotaxis protein MotA|nr:flagellar motor stator protein MotA [Deltaproteobacteria bacterium]
MNLILSFIVVTLSVFGGFAWASGGFTNFPVLLQPSEYLVILGAGIGALIGYAPLSVTKRIIKSVPLAFKGSGITKETYLQLMGLLLSIFNVIRKEGVLGLEKDLNDPHTSERFNKFPLIAKNHHAMELLISALKLFVDGVINAFDLDKLMETEIDTHNHESAVSPTLMGKMADALPGLGIVAAVLGIIITMGALGGDVAEIGHHVAAALVGTFLGILCCYGYFQPLASSIEMAQHDNHVLLNAIRAGLVAFVSGSPPAVALEFARKSIESDKRPNDIEMEKIQQDARGGSTG